MNLCGTIYILLTCEETHLAPYRQLAGCHITCFLIISFLALAELTKISVVFQILNCVSVIILHFPKVFFVLDPT